ncbi:aminotransferase class IV-domain-containing protein [Bisporella sp. PMI_857]|nr:aminotransferase class IV-domain-containing protein [Bisporella sp. PMI_857]
MDQGSKVEPELQLFSSLRYDAILQDDAIESLNEEYLDPEFRPTTFYMVSFHRDRILQAAEHFGWQEAASKIRGKLGLQYLLLKLSEASSGLSLDVPRRVRTLLSHDGTITVETNVVPKVSKYNLYPKRLPPPSSEKKFEPSPLTGGALTLGNDDAIHGDPIRGNLYSVLPDIQRTKPSPYTTFKTTSRDMYTSARERVGIKEMTDPQEVLIISEKDGEIMEGSLTTPYFWRDGKWTTPPASSGGQDGTTRRWALLKGLCVEGVVKVEDLVDGEECWVSNGVKGFIYGKIKLL